MKYSFLLFFSWVQPTAWRSWRGSPRSCRKTLAAPSGDGLAWCLVSTWSQRGAGFAWLLCKCIDHMDQGVCILHGQIIYGEIELMDDRWCWPQSFLSNREKLVNYYIFQEICGTVWSVLLDDSMTDLGGFPSRIQDWGMTWIPIEASRMAS